MGLGKIEIPFGAQNLIIESGKYAKQANGAVTVTCGDTVVLVTSCVSKQPRRDIDFFPLMVEYQEKTYAAGNIPGGFFKREGRPTTSEILTSRMIDRSIRPLFPKGFCNDVQIVALVLSSDGEIDPDILGIIGASASLMISFFPRQWNCLSLLLHRWYLDDVSIKQTITKYVFGRPFFKSYAGRCREKELMKASGFAGSDHQEIPFTCSSYH